MRPMLLAVLCLSTASPLAAQWRVALLAGNATSHGDARADTDPQHPELRADRPSTWTLSLARDAGAWRIAIDLHRTTADLAETGASSSISTTSALAAWGAAFEVARRVAGGPATPALLAGVGTAVNRWTFDLADDSPRTRLAASAALEADLPISPRWHAIIRGELTAGPSLFNATELPEGFSRRPAVRTGLVLGVARRL